MRIKNWESFNEGMKPVQEDIWFKNLLDNFIDDIKQEFESKVVNIDTDELEDGTIILSILSKDKNILEDVITTYLNDGGIDDVTIREEEGEYELIAQFYCDMIFPYPEYDED